MTRPISGAEAVLGVIAGQTLWRRCTRAQQRALLDAAPRDELGDDTPWLPGPTSRRTAEALTRRGLVEEHTTRLTPLGQAVVKWRPGKDREGEA